MDVICGRIVHVIGEPIVYKIATVTTYVGDHIRSLPILRIVQPRRFVDVFQFNVKPYVYFHTFIIIIRIIT